MNSISTAPACVHVVDQLDGVAAIKQQSCAAAIWQRQMPQNMRSWFDALTPEMLPQGRVIVAPNAVNEIVQQLCDDAGMPEGAERDWFEADVARLATLFASLMSVAHLRLRLSAVTTNSCRKFHIDAVTARLICTYRGNGTQYGISHAGVEPARIFEADPGAPIVLRGTLWPTDGRERLVHRSPPIEGTGETRLLLVIDPIFDPDEDALG